MRFSTFNAAVNGDFTDDEKPNMHLKCSASIFFLIGVHKISKCFSDCTVTFLITLCKKLKLSFSPLNESI